MADIWVNILGNASKLKSELDKADKHVSSFSEKIGKIGKIATIAGTAVTGIFTAIVLKTAAVGDQFDKMSLRTGIAVEDLSALAYASDICGADIGTLEIGIKSLTKTMDDASMGIGEGKEAFEELGISIVDVEGNLRPTIDVLKEAATKISEVENPTKQAALAMDLFGARAGPKLLPLLKMGEAGIEELMEEARRLNIVVSTESATAAADFTDAMTKLKGSFAGAGRMIGDTLIPAITPLIEKATEIVVKIKEWAEENAPLVEGIFKWGAALGVALMVLGPIAVILPSLITGFTLLAPVMLPFAAYGAIVIGFKKLSEYIKETREEAYKLKVGLADMALADIDREIDGLAVRANELQLAMSEIDWDTEDAMAATIYYKQYAAELVDINRKLGILYETREGLTKAEEEGIDVTEERAKIDAEAKKLMDELAEKETEQKKALEEKTKAAELANAQMKIENDIFALTHTAEEIAIKDLDDLRQAYLDKGVAQEIVNEWYGKEIIRLTELNEKQEEHIGIMEEVARVTKTVEDRWFELTHLPYEVKIKAINEEYDEYIKVIKESNLSILAQETAIRNINLARDLELEGVDKVTEAEKKAIEQKELLADATKAVTDRILEMTDPVAYEIQQIDELAETWRLAGVDAGLIIEAVRLMKKELAEPPEISPWEEFFNRIKDKFKVTFENTIQGGILNVIDASQNALADAFYNILSGAESLEDSMANLWKSIVDSIIGELARLAAFYVFKWIFGVPGLKVGGGASAGLGVGASATLKGFQFGGIVDTIPARLTIGEYVISKPMTDFIRRVGAIPGNLVDAIIRGMPTPVPAFAGGGSVGTPNITAQDFGENKIYIDIHDNKIANDLDIKRLAITISDEVLRKIELKRRH